ncbi:MAG: DUF4861 domain-containing protein [Flavobacteriaceae bacterium]|nr:DUF4861 domain-containing protein [Flavobacteriaceae bacterium]
MKKNNKIVILASLFFVLISCTSKVEQKSVTVHNNIDLIRESESVTISRSQLNKDFQKNFNNTLENGTIRTSFELKYDPWNINGKNISEVKKVSLDKGNNLSKFEVNFNEDAADFVVGLPIQNESAQVTFDKDLGWYSIWSPHADSELGLAIVIPSKYILDQFEYNSEEKDKSHLFIKLKTVDKKLVYYTGFGWKKSEQFLSRND